MSPARSDKKFLIILLAGICGAGGILIVIATARSPSDMVTPVLSRIQTAECCQFWRALVLLGISAMGWTASPKLITSTALGFAFSNLFFAVAFIHKTLNVDTIRLDYAVWQRHLGNRQAKP